MNMHLVIAQHSTRLTGEGLGARRIPDKWRFYLYSVDKPDPRGKPVHVSSPSFNSYDAALVSAHEYATVNGYAITEGDC